MGGSVNIEFIEVGDAHSEIGVGEELDCFGLGAAGKQGEKSF